MKRNWIIHARKKLRWIGKHCGSDGCSYIEEGYICTPLSKEEKQTHVIGSNGGITIAIIKNEDGSLSWGFSKCDKRDTYNKKIGRQIAINRANHPELGIHTSDMEFEKAQEKAMILINEIDLKRVTNTIEIIKNDIKLLTN